uniref:putative F-box protein At1g47790 n=1 Tax=Erigeron canadensis TaxID=72917 RepID=UPI001CB9530D|nr:putative F-box protein At1g47790 [Erigeron canadensis]
MSDYIIPFEVQVEIMTRLPVKSLIQFRSVSKLWKSLIDSSQFTDDYNAYQGRQQCLLIRYKDPHELHKQKYVCIVDDETFPQHKSALNAPISFQQLNNLRLVGSSQGLLCFHGEYPNPDGSFLHSRSEMAVIWNPSLNKSIEIEVPLLYDIHTTILGFGVCPNTCDPMLVKINDIYMPWQVEVFKLNSGIWRIQRCHLPRKLVEFTWSQVAIGRFIYWQTWDKISNIIVSFDMRREKFAEINLPDSLAHEPLETLSISKLRECLVVLHYYKQTEKEVCAVWMMELGIPELFSKLFTINTPGASLKLILGFRKNKEPIIETKTVDHEESATLHVYEPQSECIKDLEIHGECGSILMSSYTESLLFVNHPDGQYIKIKLQLSH